jgi:pimeloyl-ACP methyl ester carboxylesterase
MGELATSAFPGLYPEIEPRASGMLRLDAVHSMYWEECGNPAGLPVVFLHGGPGAGSTPKHRRFFDPGAYRIIVYDQRGAGRSTPLASCDNTTPHHHRHPRPCESTCAWNAGYLRQPEGDRFRIAYAEAHQAAASR